VCACSVILRALMIERAWPLTSHDARRYRRGARGKTAPDINQRRQHNVRRTSCVVFTVFALGVSYVICFVVVIAAAAVVVMDTEQPSAKVISAFQQYSAFSVVYRYRPTTCPETMRSLNTVCIKIGRCDNCRISLDVFSPRIR